MDSHWPERPLGILSKRTSENRWSRPESKKVQENIDIVHGCSNITVHLKRSSRVLRCHADGIGTLLNAKRMGHLLKRGEAFRALP